MNLQCVPRGLTVLAVLSVLLLSVSVEAQLTDLTQTPNVENAGIAKSLEQQIGAGTGDLNTPGSSHFIIARDPFRAIRRGRQLFQRKFTVAQGFGPRINDGVQDGGLTIANTPAIGNGLMDSCAGCHANPRGAAGSGGAILFTRPDHRKSPHLFGVGLKEMLGDEITSDLRAIRAIVISQATSTRSSVTLPLTSKGINYGSITANPDGTMNTSGVQGVNTDLRVRPLFADGRRFSLRELVVVALREAMGLLPADALTTLAAPPTRGVAVTPAGLVLDGSVDTIISPPARGFGEDQGEIPESVIDYFEFYLLHYFKPGTYQQTQFTLDGRKLMDGLGCTQCHIPDLQLNKDRRVADVETVHNPTRGIFNTLFATALPLFNTTPDTNFPNDSFKRPAGNPFLVRNIFTDLKRHDLGPNFHERNFDGTMTTQFLTLPLWGVGNTPPYGHDGRSMNLREVILRHGGEAQTQRDAFAGLSDADQDTVIRFLESLVIFPPDDTASTLNAGDPNTQDFPQRGHGSIALSVLFNHPSDPE